uniref:PNPLA domain-containing protein n=1 Tax=Pelusios castaneus TaxID=367368 RepID=A0A8C8RI63_9SAUR
VKHLTTGTISFLVCTAPSTMEFLSGLLGTATRQVTLVIVIGYSLPGVIEELHHKAVEETRKASILTLCPGYRMLRIIESGMRKALSENSYKVASGKLCISLTRLLDLENVIVSEFRSNEELVQVSVALFPRCLGEGEVIKPEHYIDGGMSNVQPHSDLETTITISPYTGEVDICPRDCPAYFNCICFFQSTFQLSVENLLRLSYSIFPPSLLVVREFYFQGYHDAIFFLQRQSKYSKEERAYMRYEFLACSGS